LELPLNNKFTVYKPNYLTCTHKIHNIYTDDLPTHGAKQTSLFTKLLLVQSG